MKDKLQQLKEDYQRKVKNITDIEPSNDEQQTRLAIKASCYRSFIGEIDRILNEN